MTPPAISVVVPLHNEQMVLPELLRRVGSVLSEMPGGPHEMILVDDGSSDGTLRILEDAGDFGLVSRRVVQLLCSMPEHHRYLRGMRSWVGFRQIGIPIERSERFAGESKYGLLKYLKLASDAIFSFSTIPIRAAALLGL